MIYEKSNNFPIFMDKIHMNIDLTTSLRHEISINSSGKLLDKK